MTSKIFNGMERQWRLKGSTDGAEYMYSLDRALRATGDVHEILIIRPLFYEFSCYFNSMSRNT